MGGKTIRNSATRLEALQLQSSSRGSVVPWIRGVTRVPPNLIWYNNFQAHPHTETQGGKGGSGGKTQTTNYDYTASLMLAIGHGLLIGVPSVWIGKARHIGASFGTKVGTATENYAVPGSGAMNYTTSHGAAFLCPVAVTVSGLYGTGVVTPLAEGHDWTVNPATGVFTMVGSAFRGHTVTFTYQYKSSAIVQQVLADLDLTFINGALGQPAWSGLSAYPAESLGYSGLGIVAGADYSLGQNANLDNHLFEVVAPGAYMFGSTVPDMDPMLFVRELMVDRRGGAGVPPKYVGSMQSWSDYCVAAGLLVSPALVQQTSMAEVLETAADLTGAAIKTSGGVIDVVPRADSSESGNGRTYTPNLTPLYDLNDECYTPDGSGASPLKYRLKSNGTRFNTWSMEFKNRALDYANDVADASDTADIAARGIIANTDAVQAEWIASAAVANKAVRLMMQRSVSVLREWEVPLPPHFSLIDLCDILTLTDSRLGLDRLPVFVIGIDEKPEGDLLLTCEDYPIGSASTPLYAQLDGIGYIPNYAADPGDVDPPVIFEGPATHAGVVGVEVYIAVRGSGAHWGGTQVWTSLDGTNYRKVAAIWGGARYGTLNGAVTAGATSVAVHGLGNSELVAGTAADAAALVTLCLMRNADGTGEEFFAHQGATLTGAGAYTLSGLVRGAFGTPKTGHTTGGDFVRMDDRLASSGQLDPEMIGRTLHVKCCSFNQLGVAVQALADVTDYTYVITGSQWGTLGVPYRVVARGSSDTHGPVAAGIYDMRTGAVVVTGIASYKVVTFDRAPPYAMLSANIYNLVTGGGTAAAAMAAELNGLDNDVVVVVFGATQVHRLESGLDAAMYRCGASSAVYGSPNFKVGGAYILVGIPGGGEGSGAELYNGDVASSTNAWCDLFFEIGPEGFRISGSTSTPRSLRDYSYTGDFDASAATVLVPRGDCIKNGGTVTKDPLGSAAWDSDCYSRDGYTGGAFASGVPQQDDKALMFGLSDDPAASMSFTGIDWAFYAKGDGNLGIYESGTNRGLFGTYAAGDVLAIVYDGYNIVYLQNGVVLRTVDKRPNDLKLYFDSSFFAPGGTLANCQFGPMSGVNGIGTNQLVNNVATDVFEVSVAGPVDVTDGTVVATINFGPYDFDCDVIYHTSMRVEINPTTGGVIQRAWAHAYFDSYFGGTLPAYDTPYVEDLNPFTHSLTFTQRTDYFAGASASVDLVVDGQGVIDTAYARDVRLRVEVIKR